MATRQPKTLAYQPSVFVVRTYPEPDETIASLICQGAIINIDACGPEYSHLLEMKRRMGRIGFQQEVGLVGASANFVGKDAVGIPKAFCGAMPQSGRVRPASSSSIASLMRKSSLPALESRSICSSNRCSWNSSNQSRNACSSSADSSVTNFSMVSSLPMNCYISTFRAFVIRHIEKVEILHGHR